MLHIKVEDINDTSSKITIILEDGKEIVNYSLKDEADKKIYEILKELNL